MKLTHLKTKSCMLLYHYFQRLSAIATYGLGINLRHSLKNPWRRVNWEADFIFLMFVVLLSLIVTINLILVITVVIIIFVMIIIIIICASSLLLSSSQWASSFSSHQHPHCLPHNREKIPITNLNIQIH